MERLAQSVVMSTKQPALHPEDGAKFHGEIQVVGVKIIRGSCRATLDQRHRLVSEEPSCRIFGSVAAAQEWISMVAAARGFTKVTWDEAE